MSGSYRSLIAWQKAKIVALEVYRCTRRFPRKEVYGLSSQMRRAAVSVPSNIAEGKDRYSQKEFEQFLWPNQSLPTLHERDSQDLTPKTCSSTPNATAWLRP